MIPDISPMSLAVGALVSPISSIVIEKLQLEKGVDKKIVVGLTCLLFGVAIAVGEGLAVGNWTIQGFLMNIITVLAISQTVYGLGKKNN
jgi:NhaP-type Na+/H+ or K+/H+ antiporter